MQITALEVIVGFSERIQNTLVNLTPEVMEFTQIFILIMKCLREENTNFQEYNFLSVCFCVYLNSDGQKNKITISPPTAVEFQ